MIKKNLNAIFYFLPVSYKIEYSYKLVRNFLYRSVLLNN